MTVETDDFNREAFSSDISSSFKEWACSLSGCDGGNPDAQTWVCGIEWGGGGKDDGPYYKNQLPEEIKKGRVSLSHDQYGWADSIRYPYGRSVAKLYASITDHKVEEYRTLVADKWNGSELFTLNLYPIAFNSTDSTLWSKCGLDKTTVFGEKHLFQMWCILNRFPEYAKLRREKRPKLIIGTGVGYLQDFFLCFGGDKNDSERITFGDIKPTLATSRPNPRRYYWVKLNGETLLVVIPFFTGSYGLNSNFLLQEMGERIRALCSVS
jgi:hypothetical protein